MTCVIALVTDSEKWIASDTLANDGREGIVTKTPKIFRKPLGAQGFVGLGFSGDVRVNQLVENMSFQGIDPPKPPPNQRDRYYYSYVTKTLVPYLAEYLDKEMAASSFGKGDFGTWETIILIDTSIFYLDENGSAIHLAEPYGAIGVSASIALGALHVIPKAVREKHPELVARRAVETASHFSIHTGGPVNMIRIW